MPSSKPTVYHILVRPCQRLEILLALKDLRDRVDFYVVDITRLRPNWPPMWNGDLYSNQPGLPRIEATPK